MNNKINIDGFKPKEHKELRALKRDMVATRKAFNELKDKKKHNSYEGDALLNKIDSITKEYNEKVKTLTTSEVFENQTPFDVTHFKGNKIGFSIGDLCGRNKISADRKAFLVDNYNVTECAELLATNGMGTIKNAYNDVSWFKTESSDVCCFIDLLSIPSATHEDARKSIDVAFEHVHKKHIINAENKKALDIMRKAKATVTMSPNTLQDTINSALCGNAKENTYIITNHNGFAKIDIDVNGIPQIVKDVNGNMIYKSKYVVKEVPNEIMEDTEEGSPIVIGDICSVLDFYLIEDSAMVRDSLIDYDDRQIVREIIALTTTSDDAYIHGVIA